MDLYAENILDHYRHPREQGVIADPTITQVERNISCGDEVTMQLLIEDDRIVRCAWTGTGCAISQAAMSMLAEELAGKSFQDVEAMAPQTIFNLLGVPISARRLKCALLALHALKNAIHLARKEPPQGWNATTA